MSEVLTVFMISLSTKRKMLTNIHLRTMVRELTVDADQHTTVPSPSGSTNLASAASYHHLLYVRSSHTVLCQVPPNAKFFLHQGKHLSVRNFFPEIFTQLASSHHSGLRSNVTLERHSLRMLQKLPLSPCPHYSILLISLHFLRPKIFINLHVDQLPPVAVLQSSLEQ